MNTKYLSLYMTGALLCAGLTLQAQEKPAAHAMESTVVNPKKEKTVYVELKTDMGTMVLKLYNQTPKHRDNFVKLVQKGFYDSLIFHRVINGFMIQGGDPESKNAPAGQMLGSGDVGYRVDAEFHPQLYHKKGVLAAARDNNPQKASSGCQFYIVQGQPVDPSGLDQVAARSGFVYSPEMKETYATLGGTPHLDGNYTVFGEVVEGLEVVDAIASVQTAPGDRPLKDVRMYMRVLDKAPGDKKAGK